jgi:hypothetical protein
VPISHDERATFYTLDWATKASTNVPLMSAEGAKLVLSVSADSPDDSTDGTPACYASICLTHNAPLSKELHRTTAVEFNWGLHCAWEFRVDTDGASAAGPPASHYETTLEDQQLVHSGPVYATVALRYTPRIGRGTNWGRCALTATLSAVACDASTGGVGGPDCAGTPVPADKWPTEQAPLLLKADEEAIFEYVPMFDYRVSQRTLARLDARANATAAAVAAAADATDAVAGGAIASTGIDMDNETDVAAETEFVRDLQRLKSPADLVFAATQMTLQFTVPDAEPSGQDEVTTRLEAFAAERVVPSLILPMATGYDFSNFTIPDDGPATEVHELSLVVASPRFSVLSSQLTAAQRAAARAEIDARGGSAALDARVGPADFTAGVGASSAFRLNGRRVNTGDVDSHALAAAAVSGGPVSFTDLPPARTFPIYFLVKNSAKKTISLSSVTVLSPTCQWGRSGSNCGIVYTVLDPRVVARTTYASSLPIIHAGAIKPAPAPARSSKRAEHLQTDADVGASAAAALRRVRSVIPNPLHRDFAALATAGAPLRPLAAAELAAVDPADITTLQRDSAGGVSASMSAAGLVTVAAARSVGTFAPELYLRVGNTPMVPGSLGAPGWWDARLVGSSSLTRYLETPDLPGNSVLSSVLDADADAASDAATDAGAGADVMSALWYYAIRMSGSGEAALFTFDTCPNKCSSHGSCGTGSDPHGCICEPGYNDAIDCSIGPPSTDPGGFNPFQATFLAGVGGGIVVLLIAIKCIHRACGRKRRSRRRRSHHGIPDSADDDPTLQSHRSSSGAGVGSVDGHFRSSYLHDSPHLAHDAPALFYGSTIAPHAAAAGAGGVHAAAADNAGYSTSVPLSTPAAAAPPLAYAESPVGGYATAPAAAASANSGGNPVVYYNIGAAGYGQGYPAAHYGAAAYGAESAHAEQGYGLDYGADYGAAAGFGSDGFGANAFGTDPAGSAKKSKSKNKNKPYYAQVHKQGHQAARSGSAAGASAGEAEFDPARVAGTL